MEIEERIEQRETVISPGGGLLFGIAVLDSSGSETPNRVLFGRMPSTATVDPGTHATGPIPRRRVALAVAPFIALGLADVMILLVGGVDPLWGFVIFPPIAFMCVLGWIVSRTKFVPGRPD